MKKNGFTLVELLAVIVILAIILAVAIPSVTSITNNVKREAMINDTRLIIKAIDYKLLQDSSFDVSSINASNISTLLNISPNNYQSITATSLNNKPYVIIEGKNKWANLVTSGSNEGVKVVDTTVSTYANPPLLVAGMTPIKWESNAWVDTTVSDPNWYNYSTGSKQWANARTQDGSMWVWIPRYIYKISAGWHNSVVGTMDIQFSRGIDDNWNSSVIGNISAVTTSNASNNTWTNHPGFTFGATQLLGIWVAKFEPTAAEGVANGYTADGSCLIGGDNVTTKTVKIIPNATTWRCLSIGNMYTLSRSMETKATYGWGTNGVGIDTHMMKNIEWGTVSYLSKSIYGQNTNEVWPNPNRNYLTGCAGTATNSGDLVTCNPYSDMTNGIHASTTGNIYGIYDMSSGAWEYTAAYINNNHAYLNTYGPSIISALDQYKDIYTVTTDNQATNYSNALNKKGDAVYETSNNYSGQNAWFDDSSIMLSVDCTWFLRGGLYNGYSTSGLFHFNCSSGDTLSRTSFRPVLLIANGL